MHLPDISQSLSAAEQEQPRHRVILWQHKSRCGLPCVLPSSHSSSSLFYLECSVLELWCSTEDEGKAQARGANETPLEFFWKEAARQPTQRLKLVERG